MKDILEKVNRNDGMTVPDGYFDDFAARMAASLPEREWEKPAPRVMPSQFLAESASVYLSRSHVYGRVVHDEDV